MPASREELGARGRLAARSLFKKLRMKGINEIDVDALVVHHGLRIRRGLTGARGRLTVRGSRGFIRVADRITEEAQRRFVVAHELGHYIMHASRGLLSLCTEGDFLEYAPGNAETEANVFAAELLMPQALFERKCDVEVPGLDAVRELAEEFGTTLTATAIRFVDLCPEPCAVVWCEAGIIKWAIRGKEFYPWIARGRRLDSYSHAFDAFRGKLPPKAPESVPLRAWADSGNREVMEHTAFFSSLRATLTILWLQSGEE